ncbi:hypothetical protein [Algoriphagus antarcticus]|uniref:Uncharacterized protein n=1 Tax=Algoriphagus antarcticus TaxID=238540 RepID=A0A3E0DF91_9BACT|nr:hypothetical protein [Algoriphagus antarcticus]REG81247.1 hypothetical protein C8N25_12837 [Algoriphagus antarcticus]
MKTLLKRSIPLIMAIGLFTSCGDMTKKVEDKLKALHAKAEQLDSLVNREYERVLTLDTLINFENEKIEKLDSLINKSSSRIDSIANKKIELLEKIVDKKK